LRTTVYLYARNFVFACTNCVWVSKTRPKICYKKYLGPDWEPDYKEASACLANHTAFMDAWMHAVYRTPSFVMKKSSCSIPFIQIVADLSDALLIGSDKASI
jgi:1-acyl-sn-glycerol-3-phosphate acyltransferase